VRESSSSGHSFADSLPAFHSFMRSLERANLDGLYALQSPEETMQIDIVLSPMMTTEIFFHNSIRWTGEKFMAIVFGGIFRGRAK